MKLSLKSLFELSLYLSIASIQAAELNCFSTVYAPYSFIVKGEPTGIDIDIITEIAKQIDISVSFEIIPWSRLKLRMLSGEIDCAAALLQSSAYDQTMSYMKNPITTGDYTLFIEAAEHDRFNRITDFYGFTIAVNRGFDIPFTLEQAMSKDLIEKYEVENTKQSMQMLATRRVKGVLADKNVGLYYLQQLNIKNIISISTPLKSTPVFLVFSKKWEKNGVLDKFEVALKKIKADGTYQKIIDKYLVY